MLPNKNKSLTFKYKNKWLEFLVQYLTNTELEFKRLRSVSGRVELLSVLQGAGVVHRQHVGAGGHLVAEI